MDVVVKRKRVLCRSIYCWMQSVTVCCCFTGVRQLAHAASILCATVPAHSPTIVVVPSSSISKWSAMAAEIVYIPFQSCPAHPGIPEPLQIRRRERDECVAEASKRMLNPVAVVRAIMTQAAVECTRAKCEEISAFSSRADYQQNEETTHIQVSIAETMALARGHNQTAFPQPEL
jgi:hypothetical protein